MVDFIFYSRGSLIGRLSRDAIDRYLAAHATAAFNGRVLTITGPDGEPEHTAHVGLGGRRVAGDWVNEFNARRNEPVPQRRRSHRNADAEAARRLAAWQEQQS